VRIGSLFSGIGGLDLGLERAGVGQVVWQCEINPYCRAVLAKHWPEVPCYEDITSVTASNVERVDVLCGGFPCQDVSGAGKGAGLAGARSGLWYQYARLVGELSPEWAVVENVASGAGRWLDAVVRSLGELGYASLPLPIEAADVGAPHRRARIFVVARRVPNADRAAIRLGTERGPLRRAGRVCDQKEPEPGDVGDGLAHANSDRRGGRGLAEHGYEQSKAGAEPDRCCGDGGFGWPPGPLDDAGWVEWLSRGGPAPGAERPVRGGSDGVSYRMDRRFRREALRALGNAVVPQCAEVAGHVLLSLLDESTAPGLPARFSCDRNRRLHVAVTC